MNESESIVTFFLNKDRSFMRQIAFLLSKSSKQEDKKSKQKVKMKILCVIKIFKSSILQQFFDGW